MPYRSGVAQVVPCHVGPGARASGSTYPTGGRGSYPPQGAAPRGVPAGGLHFSCEKWRKEHQGGGVSSSLDPPSLVWDILRDIPLFLWTGLRPWPSPWEGARPPAGRAGRRRLMDEGRGLGKIQPKHILPKESFQIRARTWASKKALYCSAAPLSQKIERAPASGFISRGCRGNPLRLFASGLSLRESLDPRPG